MGNSSDTPTHPLINNSPMPMRDIVINEFNELETGFELKADPAVIAQLIRYSKKGPYLIALDGNESYIISSWLEPRYDNMTEENGIGQYKTDIKFLQSLRCAISISFNAIATIQICYGKKWHRLESKYCPQYTVDSMILSESHNADGTMLKKQ